MDESINCAEGTLPLFSSVTEWSKIFAEWLTNFTLVNIIVYLVCGLDKTFSVDALQAHNSVKTNKFFYDFVCKECMVS